MSCWYTTQPQLRAAFWAAHPEHRCNRVRGSYPADVRVLFSYWLDQQHRAGNISRALAERAYL